MFNVQRSKIWHTARQQAGFSMFELLACLIIISVLAAVLLNRLGYYKEMLEKAAMESTLRNIKTGLQVQLAELIVANRQSEAARLETEDPVQWQDVKPLNYGGRYEIPPDPGYWYFDASQGQLVYVVTTGDRLDLDGDSGTKEIRFRARLLKDRLKLNGTEVESVSGVSLTPVRPYKWR